MKGFLLILLVVPALFLACNNNQGKAGDSKTTGAAALKTIEVKVEGMSCTSCENTIQESVQKLPGISSVKADHQAKKTTVTYDTTKTNVASIKEAIGKCGYQVVE